MNTIIADRSISIKKGDMITINEGILNVYRIVEKLAVKSGTQPVMYKHGATTGRTSGTKTSESSLPQTAKKTRKISRKGDTGEKILKILEHTPRMSPAEIIRVSGFSSSRVHSSLQKMKQENSLKTTPNPSGKGSLYSAP